MLAAMAKPQIAFAVKNTNLPYGRTAGAYADLAVTMSMIVTATVTVTLRGGLSVQNL